MSPARYTEDELVERPAMALLEELGWEIIDAFSEKLGAAVTLGRDSFADVILTHRLRTALRDLNPNVPVSVLDEAATAMNRDRSGMDPTRANNAVRRPE